MFKESLPVRQAGASGGKAGVVSIAAMLNKHGRGEVYFGINDDGKVLGQTIGRMTLKDVTQAVRESF